MTFDLSYLSLLLPSGIPLGVGSVLLLRWLVKQGMARTSSYQWLVALCMCVYVLAPPLVFFSISPKASLLPSLSSFYSIHIETSYIMFNSTFSSKHFVLCKPITALILQSIEKLVIEVVLSTLRPSPPSCPAVVGSLLHWSILCQFLLWSDLIQTQVF